MGCGSLGFPFSVTCGSTNACSGGVN
jgi:hypothetical protein